MVLDTMKNHGQLCLGVHRKVKMTEDSEVAAGRFVITNPAEDFILNPTDMIYSVQRAEYVPSSASSSKSRANDVEEFGDEYAEEEKAEDSDLRRE